MSLGLALSGGAAKGIAHIRVWERFLEQRIRVDAIAGASAGALFGGMIAFGYTPGEMRGIVDSPRFKRIVRQKYRNLNLSLLQIRNLKLGLFRLEKFRDYLRSDIFRGATFADLKIPFTCSYTDLQENSTGYFFDGDVAEAVTYSMTFPMIFRSLNDRFYDGGLKVNCPVDVLLDRFHMENVVAVDLSFIPRRDTRYTRTLGQFLNRMMDAVWCETFLDDLRRAHIVVEPEMGDFTFFDFHRYEDARRAVDEKLTEEVLRNIRALAEPVEE